jgi:hypothetical protein
MMKTNVENAIGMNESKQIEVIERLFDVEKELIALKNEDGVRGSRAEDCIETAEEYLQEARNDIEYA